MLSAYHISKQQRTPERSRKLLIQKEVELLQIPELEKFKASELTKIAILGVADSRHVRGHQELFAKILGHETDIFTFDITTEHLKGEEKVYEQDVTEAIPHGQYDIVYSHVLLKFIPKDKQMSVIDNSYSVLRPGGIAVHIFGVGDRYKENDPTADEIQAHCEKMGYQYHFIQFSTGGVAVVVSKK